MESKAYRNSTRWQLERGRRVGHAAYKSPHAFSLSISEMHFGSRVS